MKEKRKTQVVVLLDSINCMFIEDYGESFFHYQFDGDALLIQTDVRDCRFMIELLLQRLMNVSVYVHSNYELKVLFYD